MERTPAAWAVRAAATIVAASATVLASGFSHSTCLPASSAAMAISACESPGVTMSMTSMSSHSTTARQSVAVSPQPQRAAALAVRSASRPASTAIVGVRGRGYAAGACRQPTECAAPMNPWPIIATRSDFVIVLSRNASGGRRRGRPPDEGSGREGELDELVDVLLGHHRRIEHDAVRHAGRDQVAEGLVLGDEARERDAVDGLRRRVDDRRLDDAVVGLDAIHHVDASGAADHEELTAARGLDRRHD